jgi:predicted nucleotidyltransferase
MQWTSRERVTRDEAEQRLAEVIERASVINADDDYAMVITAIVVFGAFLRTDKAMIGDVDVAVALQPRFGRTREQDEAEARAR